MHQQRLLSAFQEGGEVLVWLRQHGYRSENEMTLLLWCCDCVYVVMMQVCRQTFWEQLEKLKNGLNFTKDRSMEERVS